MPEDKGKENEGSQTPPEKTDTGTDKTQPLTIDWTKVKASDIPESLIKENPEFKKVLEETIDRRKKIKTLTTQLEDISEGKKPEDKSESKKDESKVTETGMPEWFKPFADKLENMDKSNLENWRANAGKVTGLAKSPTILKTISGNSEAEVIANAEKIASELGIPKPVAQTAVGNVTGERDKSVIERAKKINRGQQNTDIFSPAFADQHGGGVYEDN